MSEIPPPAPGPPAEPPIRRCPNCDTVVSEEATQCIMCGALLPAETIPRSAKLRPTQPLPAPAHVEPERPPLQPAPEVVEFTMRERRSPITFWLTALFTILIIILGSLVWQYQDPVATVALVPSPTPLPPTLTYTPTNTPLPTETSPPTMTPTVTPTPAPTDTPRPPRFHTVSSGETLIGLAQVYRVSAESIALENNFALDTPIQTNQQLVIPWPTATPPLESVLIQINNETAIADVTGCEIYQVQRNDTAIGIANQKGVPLEAIIRVNRQTQESIQLLQPGDVLCIPRIVYTDALPPTPGPSPTATSTLPPPGPHLLYPVANAVIDPPDSVITLQWAAVKDLTDTEWYMVELTDVAAVDNLPHRGFTRDSSFRVPLSWRPPVNQLRQMRWRVSVVQVTGWRADGRPIYTYGGETSRDAFFTWLGAVPTPTPTATHLPGN